MTKYLFRRPNVLYDKVSDKGQMLSMQNLIFRENDDECDKFSRKKITETCYQIACIVSIDKHNSIS
jgi:hypothetical protein